MLVEALAIAELGQAVRGGVAARLLQPVAKHIHFGGRGRQPLLQRFAVRLNLLGGRRQGVDQRLEGGGFAACGQALARALQGLAVRGLTFLSGLDRLAHRRQFAA